jgi:hypothetical protein
VLDVSLDSPDEPPTPVLTTRSTEWDGSISSDGRWMVYASCVAGRKEVGIGIPFVRLRANTLFG